MLQITSPKIDEKKQFADKREKRKKMLNVKLTNEGEKTQLIWNVEFSFCL
jgi:hypothetical protein